jgi:chromate transport protein ChrA
MFAWLLIAIVVIGGAAAIVNDIAYGGALFSSATIVSAAMLSALTLWIGRGFLRDATSGRWPLHALIWVAVVLCAMILFRLLSSGGMIAP